MGGFIMARDFGVEKEEYKAALEEIRKIELPESHWNSVAELIEQESKKAAQSVKEQRVDDDPMHKRFTI